MDAYDCVTTKLDVRNYSSKGVPSDLIARVLQAGRLASSGMNRQHWRFILVRDRENLKRLAQASATGKWVEGANFAMIVLTNPRYGFHAIDAGRAVEDMQIAAWNYGIVSCVFTGVGADKLRKDFDVPEELSPTIVVGFGYPARRTTGKGKNRKPLKELAFLEKYDGQFDRNGLA
jgi:nitroreductase